MIRVTPRKVGQARLFRGEVLVYELQLCRGGRESQAERSACQGPMKGMTSVLADEEQRGGQDGRDREGQWERAVTRGGHRWRKMLDHVGLYCQGERVGC